MNDLRYSRQVLFAPIGVKGQKRLKAGSVVIMGCGGLGTTSAHYLARAGVGRIRIIDRDIVELENIHRQMLFDEADARQHRAKAAAAVAHLKKVNSTIRLESEVTDIQARNIEKLIKGFDLVVDGLDNMETRYLVNDACVKHKIPWIYGAAVSSYGMTMNIIPGKTPCLGCALAEIEAPVATPTCAQIGIINTIPGLIAALQATEAIKILLKSAEIDRSLTYIDLWQRSCRRINVKRRQDCPTCGR
jgi:adenylyltransferase/sulfurtransferase